MVDNKGKEGRQTDIERRQTDIEIDEKTLPFMEKLADSMPGGFFIYHAGGGEELIYYNQSMLRIFGCETEEEFQELTGNSFNGIVHPDDLDAVEESIWEQIQNDKYNMDYVEYRIIRKDGTVRWVEDYGHLTHSSLYGDVFYVFIDDATDRLRKRMADLEEINEELRNAYDRESQYKRAIIKNATFFFEVNLSQDRFLTMAAPAADEQAAEVCKVEDVMPVDSYSRRIEWAEGRVNEGERAAYRQFFDIERLIRCYQKEELEQIFEVWETDSVGRRRLNRYVVLLGRQETTGDIIGLYVCTDITEQIERQNLLQIALRQAQSANIARSSFLANMSHDFNTPLNAIVGYADLLLEYSDEPKVLDYVKKIRQAGSELMAIVKEAMEVTWARSGKAVLAEVNCDLDDIIREMADGARPMVEKKGLTFYLEADEIRHKSIYVDKMRLKEIIDQLISNAVNYSKENGYVRLTVREEPNAPEGYAQFSFAVEDNGIGIAEDFKEDLFRAFARERNTTMSRILGPGLGLTVVKAFVDMMEGSVDVESSVGKGSTLTVRILFKLGEEDSHAKDSAQAKVLDRLMLIGRRILLVEDNELNAEIAEELLTQSGFYIDTAENGQAALEKIKNSKPGYYSAVLMDIQMPVMDGYEAARQIRMLENRELANIPIVALSANVFAEDQQKSLASGMDAHFPKPIEIDGLIDLLCRVLGKVLA